MLDRSICVGSSVLLTDWSVGCADLHLDDAYMGQAVVGGACKKGIQLVSPAHGPQSWARYSVVVLDAAVCGLGKKEYGTGGSANCLFVGSR